MESQPTIIEKLRRTRTKTINVSEAHIRKIVLGNQIDDQCPICLIPFSQIKTKRLIKLACDHVICKDCIMSNIEFKFDQLDDTMICCQCREPYTEIVNKRVFVENMIKHKAGKEINVKFIDYHIINKIDEYEKAIDDMLDELFDELENTWFNDIQVPQFEISFGAINPQAYSPVYVPPHLRAD